MPEVETARAVAYDSANNYLYVANENSSNVSVINGAINAIIGNIRVGYLPDAIAYDPSNRNIYVANLGMSANMGSISVIVFNNTSHEPFNIHGSLLQL